MSGVEACDTTTGWLAIWLASTTTPAIAGVDVDVVDVETSTAGAIGGAVDVEPSTAGAIGGAVDFEPSTAGAIDVAIVVGDWLVTGLLSPACWGSTSTP